MIGHKYSATIAIMKVGTIIAFLFCLSSCFVLLVSPIARNLFLLPTHYPYHNSAHPPSPLTPRKHALLLEQVLKFRHDGILVLKHVLSDDLKAKLEIAGNDVMASPVRHCEMSRFSWSYSFFFHNYTKYCSRPQLLHDYLRDVVYQGPFSHIAAQLMGIEDPNPNPILNASHPGPKPNPTLGDTLRVHDVFMAGRQLPKRWHNDYLAFAPEKTQNTPNVDRIKCLDGIVMWMPLETSIKDRNGMLFLNGTSKMMAEHFADNPNSAQGLRVMFDWIKNLDKSDFVAPSLELGDVVVFDKCTVHTASGFNPDNFLRRAYQLRFSRLQSPPSKAFLSATMPAAEVHGTTIPQVWPTTIEEEDALRAQGPLVFGRKEWLDTLMAHPLDVAFSSMMYTLVSLRMPVFGNSVENLRLGGKLG